jgi:DDE superfamily endonuclease
MLSYRVTLDVPVRLVLFVSGLLDGHHREIGTRRGKRADLLQAGGLLLAWFRDLAGHRVPGPERGHRGARREGAFPAQAPEKAKDLALPFLILDDAIIPAGRRAEKTTSRKGHVIDRWYSGKAHHPGGNIQALSAPGRSPGVGLGRAADSTHDLTARPRARPTRALPYLANLPHLADSGYEGAGAGVHVPVKKPARGRELDPDTRTRNTLLRSLRYQGERSFALMSQRWRALQRVMLSPGKIGDIAKAALVLVRFDHKMIS